MSSPEFFATEFLTAVETGWTGVDAPPEYANDPRSAKISRALRAAGVEKAFILGAGSFGIAAAIQDGRVAKLTIDESEVEAGSVLRNHQLPHVARIDGSWFVRDVAITRWNSGTQHRVGLLLQERVSVLEQRRGEGQEITRIWKDVRAKHEANPDQLSGMPRGEARRVLLETSIDLERALRSFARQNDSGSEATMASQVADGLRELRDVGVFAIDVHAGNIGYSHQDGVFKIFDIGSSSSPRDAKPGELPAETALDTARTEPGRPGGMVEEGVVVPEIGGEDSASQVAEEASGAELLLTPEQVEVARDNKALGFIRMKPTEFLQLTALMFDKSGNINSYDEIMRTAASLDDYNARPARVAPYLSINIEDKREAFGQVIEHEGRHRAAAVHKASGKSMLVAIRLMRNEYPIAPRTGIRLKDMPRVLLDENHAGYRVPVSLDGAIDLYPEGGGAAEEMRSAHDRRIDDLVTKYMAILGVTQRPRIVIHDNVGSPWLGRDIWTIRDPSTSTIELQKSILADDRTLERIVAHEMVHHRDAMNLSDHDLVLLAAGIKPDGHGASFRQGAALINEAMGADFVTKTSDQTYATTPTKPFYVLISGPGELGRHGKLGYRWAVRLTDEAKAIIDQEVAKGGRLVMTTNDRWTHGKAKIRKWSGWNLPNDQAELKALYDSAATSVAV